MGQVLSNCEVEAILAALDFNSSTLTTASKPSGKEDPIDLRPYDFAHPEPLRKPQLDGLRIASASISHLLEERLSNVLHSAAQVDFLGIEQSTFRDYLATSERPGCLAVLEWTSPPRTCLLDMSRPLAFSMISCLMGGEPAGWHDSSAVKRPFSELESRLIQKVIRTVLPGDVLVPARRSAFGESHDDNFRVTNLVSDPSQLFEATSNEAVALVSYEIVCGSTHGMMQLCIPWKQVALALEGGSDDAARFREKLRTRAVNVPVIATARIASFRMSTRDLASLSTGDLVLTDVPASGEVGLSVDGNELFRGMPGQCSNRKVIRLTGSSLQKRTEVADSEDRMKNRKES